MPANCWPEVWEGHGGTFTLASAEGRFTEVTIALPVG
ncbi:sensor histidine kinase [Hymenobacter sp. BRD128]|nr:sensor histidine kinase [Hymenobacter sp. BRD128]